MNHRTDIDGLRAVAVLAVLGSHLKLPYLSGGFVGVDVFFVISGYLIASIVYGETAAGTFSFGRFYERRVRRIVPALLFVTLLTAALAWIYLWPVEMAAFAESVAWSLAFLPNVHFGLHTGYFDPNAEALPLLHYWSLGVEEQFYIAFPIVVVVLTKWARRWLLPVLFIALFGSFAWAEYQTLTLPGSAFYLPQYRAWELLIGCILALPQFPAAANAWQRSLVGIVGLAAIAGSSFGYGPATPFPGATALLPTLGSAAVIWSAAGPVAALLSVRPVAYIGKISYSLYLVHWPLIVFSGQLFPHADPIERVAAILALSFALAVFSYHFIEQPVRRGMVLKRRRVLFVAAVTSVAVVLAAGAALASLGGIPGRVPPQVQAIEAFAKYDYDALYRLDTCFMRPDQGINKFDREHCLSTRPGKSLVIWGDSLAAHYYSAFASVFARDDVQVGQATASACPPVVNVAITQRPLCETFNKGVYDLLLQHPPTIVVLSADWGWSTLDDVNKLPNTISGLEAAGIKVVVLGIGPVYSNTVPAMIAKDLADHLPVEASSADFLPTVAPAEQAMDAMLSGRHDIVFVPVAEELCKTGRCPLLVDPETPIHWDNAHFTKEGAVLVTGLFADRIRAILAAD